MRVNLSPILDGRVIYYTNIYLCIFTTADNKIFLFEFPLPFSTERQRVYRDTSRTLVTRRPETGIEIIVAQSPRNDK